MSSSEWRRSGRAVGAGTAGGLGVGGALKLRRGDAGSVQRGLRRRDGEEEELGPREGDLLLRAEVALGDRHHRQRRDGELAAGREADPPRVAGVGLAPRLLHDLDAARGRRRLAEHGRLLEVAVDVGPLRVRVEVALLLGELDPRGQARLHDLLGVVREVAALGLHAHDALVVGVDPVPAGVLVELDLGDPSVNRGHRHLLGRRAGRAGVRGARRRSPRGAAPDVGTARPDSHSL
jgi:hypothetical protein